MLCAPHNEMLATSLLSESAEGMAYSVGNQCGKQRFSSQCECKLSYMCSTVSATRMVSTDTSRRRKHGNCIQWLHLIRGIAFKG